MKKALKRSLSTLYHLYFIKIVYLLILFLLFFAPYDTYFRVKSNLVTLVDALNDDTSEKLVSESEDGYIASNNNLETNEKAESDRVDDGFYDPIVIDPSCYTDKSGDENDCWSPPASTIETEIISNQNGSENGNNNDDDEKEIITDKHWGSDQATLKMRDKLRKEGNGVSSKSKSAEEKVNDPHSNVRPPVFLMPGLASTRLVSWKYKACSNSLLGNIKVQDYVWVNMNMMLQLATIDGSCFLECMTLGLNQTDMDDENIGCKLRPDEGLDAISSLAPGSFSSNLLMGSTNTIYAWLTQWLADNLGYDVSSIVGLPYDWRLSPDIMEKRDGFLTLTRKRIEAAVATNGLPGILIAHSMGNNVVRYFLEWLRHQIHDEVYAEFMKKMERREKLIKPQQKDQSEVGTPGWVSASVPVEPLVEYSVTDRMYKLGNTFANGVDHLLRYYFPSEGEKREIGKEKLENIEEESIAHEQSKKYYAQLWELAQMEGDAAWLEWINKHIWTYIGLSAPLIGAINPMRAVLSGEDMGMPLSEKDARAMELSFGSTHSINPIATKTGFCDGKNEDFSDSPNQQEMVYPKRRKSNLACLDELIDGIDKSEINGESPWKHFRALKNLLKERVDWDTDVSPFTIQREFCLKSEKAPCGLHNETFFSAEDVQTGNIFTKFSEVWKEKGNPLQIKREQLESSWWNNRFPYLLSSTWDRPHIKHVIMAYGVDMPTEIGYKYKKTEIVEDKEPNEEKKSTSYDDLPKLRSVVWEEKGGELVEEVLIGEPKTLTESMLLKRKPKRRPLKKGKLHHSGDGSVPYLSLSWSHTWLLHATRAMRHTKYEIGEGERISDDNALHSIKLSYRPKGGSVWLDGGKPENDIGENGDKSNVGDSDTGAAHPHGTKYKPEMFRFQSKGKSRSTGMEYTTAVIEASGVEHKEATRNYDILAAVFTDVLKHMHDDFGLV